MHYRFELKNSTYGLEDCEALEGLDRVQLVAAAHNGGGVEGTTPRDFVEHWAEELGDSPDTIGFETYEVFEDDDKEPRFGLLYFPWSDSGTLFHAGTADFANLALWPEGFRPKHGEPAADADALTDAFNARKT